MRTVAVAEVLQHVFAHVITYTVAVPVRSCRYCPFPRCRTSVLNWWGRGWAAGSTGNQWSIPSGSQMIAGMSIDMFTDPGTDPRADSPTQADERATIVAFLRWQRDTLELKCSGLDGADLARRSVEPSTLSLLGLVRHMAEVERRWFRRVMAGQDAPPYFRSDTDPDGDFDGAAPDPEVVAQAWDVWRAEVAFTDRFVAEAPDLDVTGKIPECL
jgi:Protein of unknown function (DUF664)